MDKQAWQITTKFVHICLWRDLVLIIALNKYIYYNASFIMIREQQWRVNEIYYKKIKIQFRCVVNRS